MADHPQSFTAAPTTRSTHRLAALPSSVVQPALELAVEASSRSGSSPVAALWMLTAAAGCSQLRPQATCQLWEEALAACLDASQPKPVIEALLDGAATHLVATERGKDLLGEAVSGHLVHLLGPPSLALARSLAYELDRLPQLVSSICFGAKGADMAKASIRSVRAGGPSLDVPDVGGRRWSLTSVGCHLSGLRDYEASSSYLMGMHVPPRPKRLQLVVDMLTLMGFEQSPTLGKVASSTVRSFFSRVHKAEKKKKRASALREGEAKERSALETKEAAELALDLDVQDWTSDVELAVDLEALSSRAVQRRFEEASDLWDRIDDDLPMSVDACSLFYFTVTMVDQAQDEEFVTEWMEELMEALADGEPLLSLTGYIATLAQLEEFVSQRTDMRKSWSDGHVRLFLSATEGLTSFLETHTEGTAEERQLAYGLLAQLLRNRQRASLYAEVRPGQPASPLASPLDGRSSMDSSMDVTEAPLEVIRMAAAEGAPLGSSLLRDLMTVQVGTESFTAAELSTVIRSFVEAGGRPSGEQLALASLGALGFTHEFSSQGAHLATFHNTTTLRAAWYDLKAVWQLASRPEVQRGLWPQLGSSGMAASQVMEPLQDILLLGAVAQLQFMCDASTLAWDLDELRSELRCALGTTSLPACKVDALLHGDVNVVLSRLTLVLNMATADWLAAGGWSVERRMYAPLLSKSVCALDEETEVNMSAGARLGANGQWEYDGTIAPRLHRGLLDPNCEDHAWAKRVVRELKPFGEFQGGSKAMMKLLCRAQEALRSGEALAMDTHEARLAETVAELFSFDLSQLETWSEQQKLDLNAVLSYVSAMQRTDALAAATAQRQSKRQVVSASRSNGRGFGAASKRKRKRR